MRLNNAKHMDNVVHMSVIYIHWKEKTPSTWLNVSLGEVANFLRIALMK